jgi:hypothetical protein
VVETVIWYVAYGSNMAADRLNAYLLGSGAEGKYGSHRAASDGSPPQMTRVISVPHSLYFAGPSIRWHGGVAFLSLQRSRDTINAIAYRMTLDQFRHLIASENGVEDFSLDLDPASIPEGSWTPLPVFADGTDTRAKYNALLRLPNFDEFAAITLTTWRDLPLCAPSQSYLDVFKEGLEASDLEPGNIAAYISGLVRESETSTHQPINAGSYSTASDLNVNLPAVAGEATGFPSLAVNKTYREITGSMAAPVLGWLNKSSSNPTRCWIYATLDDGEKAIVSEQCADLLQDNGWAVHNIQLTIPVPIRFRRESGRMGDIQGADVLQINPADAHLLGDWALVASPHLSAPMRVKVRPHVVPGTIRLGYASRLLLGLAPHENVVCQPIRRAHKSLWAHVCVLWVKLLEWIFGAPPVAFRSTEGLVGDDGRAIVRVDTTALDFLGLDSGDRVVVSWARNRTLARVLLHTDLTRSWMNQHQLIGATGAQLRVETGSVESRIKSPEHLRVALSSTVRSALEIPPDTVVRLRRSLPFMLRKNAALLSIPVTGLFVAIIAVPDVPKWYAAAFVVLVTALTGISLRLK